ncbi:hypothetical protein B2J93_5022 [Marssonina coronariae]|uniref:Uncharacterized protein n=1 Tax=Diplocarpon coronariae TaxID=2795749 RepID=A0A218Z5C8_9HELO|nr:hypothetical protein B2J93_5022 [Marssonina coronariae]
MPSGSPPLVRPPRPRPAVSLPTRAGVLEAWRRAPLAIRRPCDLRPAWLDLRHQAPGTRPQAPTRRSSAGSPLPLRSACPGEGAEACLGTCARAHILPSHGRDRPGARAPPSWRGPAGEDGPLMQPPGSSSHLAPPTGPWRQARSRERSAGEPCRASRSRHGYVMCWTRRRLPPPVSVDHSADVDDVRDGTSGTGTRQSGAGSVARDPVRKAP